MASVTSLISNKNVIGIGSLLFEMGFLLGFRRGTHCLHDLAKGGVTMTWRSCSSGQATNSFNAFFSRTKNDSQLFEHDFIRFCPCSLKWRCQFPAWNSQISKFTGICELKRKVIGRWAHVTHILQRKEQNHQTLTAFNDLKMNMWKIYSLPQA